MANTDQADAYRKLQELYADMSDEKLEDMAEGIGDLTEIAQQVLRAEISKRGLDGQGTPAASEGGRPGFEVTPPGPAPRNWSVQTRGSTAGRDKTVEDSDRDESAPGDREDTDSPLQESPDAEDGSKPPLDLWGMGVKDPFLQGTDSTAYDPVTVWWVDDAAEAREVTELLKSGGIEFFLGPENVGSLDDFKGNYKDGVEIKVMKFQSRFVQNGLWRAFPPDPEQSAEAHKEFSLTCPKCNSPDVILEGLVADEGKKTGHAERNRWSCDACGHQWEDEGIVENA